MSIVSKSKEKENEEVIEPLRIDIEDEGNVISH